MWMFVAIIALLGQNQAAPFPGNVTSFQLILQQQQAQTTVDPVVTQRQTSSSSSSSSDTSESSQSSEEPQPLRERQNLENTAVEQSSQESTEVLQAPGDGTNSLWVNQLVEQRAEPRDEEPDHGDDTGQHRAQTLLTPPGDAGSTETDPAGGRAAPAAAAEDFLHLLDHSTEEADGLTSDLLGLRGYHGNEAELELRL